MMRLCVISSSPARTADVKVPLMPPPSRLRMRNGGPPLVACPIKGGLLAFISDRLLFAGFNAAAEPDTERVPSLVEEEPFRDPRHYRVREGQVRRPFAGAG